MRARFAAISAAAAIALFVATVASLELGRAIGQAQPERVASSQTAVGVVDGVVSAVLALLLGFVFSGAMSRFDQRRKLIVQQVNAIRSAWQRIDSLPSDRHPEIRNAFRQFVDALTTWYGRPAGADSGDSVTRARDELWARSVAICVTADGERARMLLLPALTDMFAAVEHERLARRIHPPAVIYAMLVVASLVAALLEGYTMATSGTRNWLLQLAVAAIVALVMYVIIQIEYPRLGLVRLEAFDRAVVELRATMN